jgi:hypothetical protein
VGASCIASRLLEGGPHRLLDEPGQGLDASEVLLLAGAQPLHGARQLAGLGRLDPDDETSSRVNCTRAV